MVYELKPKFVYPHESILGAVSAWISGSLKSVDGHFLVNLIQGQDD